MLIADDFELIRSLRGEFSCFCDFKINSTTQTANDVIKMNFFNQEVNEACKEYDKLK